MKNFCGSCGTEQQSAQAFCTGCGTRHDEAATPVVAGRGADEAVRPDPDVPPQAPPHGPQPGMGQFAPNPPPNALAPGAQVHGALVPGAPSPRSGVPGWAIALVAGACVLVLVLGIAVVAVLFSGDDGSGDSSEASGGGTGSVSAGEGGGDAPADTSHPLGADAAVAWAEEISHDLMALQPVVADGDRIFVLQEGVTSVRDLDNTEVYSLQGQVAAVRDGNALVLEQSPGARGVDAVALVSADDGTQVWSRDMDGMTPGTAQLTPHGVVLEVSGVVSVHAVDSGDEVWSEEFGDVETLSRSGDVLVSLDRDRVRAVDVRTGKVLVEKQLDDWLTVPGTVVTGDVLVVSEGDEARGWDLESGKELWHEDFDLGSKPSFSSAVKPYELPDGAVLLQGYDDDTIEYVNRVRDAKGGTAKYAGELAPYLIYEEGGKEYAATGDGVVIDSDLQEVAEAYAVVAHVPGGLYVFDDTLSFFAHGESEATWRAPLGKDAGEGSLQGAHLVDGGVLLHWREQIVLVR